MNPNKKRLSRISPEKAFYELLKTIKRKVWLGVTWLGLAWLGLQEMYHLLISPIYLNNPKFCDFVIGLLTARDADVTKRRRCYEVERL